MTISRNITRFNGLPIEQYDKTRGIQNSDHALRLEVAYEDADAGETLHQLFESVLADPKAEHIKALVIGAWEESFESNSQTLIDALIANSARLKQLTALFVGEMTFEDCEISWIQQNNYAGLWAKFAQLEHFQVRGGTGLELGDLVHANLKTLIIETGGLPKNVLSEIADGSLPALEKLELWLGDDEYGWDAQIDDLRPLLEPERFPKLKYLGLRDSIIADAIAELLADAPLLNQLEVLDLSLGTLGDQGAQALLKSDAIKGLKKLDLHHHYIGETLRNQLSALDIAVDLSDIEEEDDSYRYIAVSE